MKFVIDIQPVTKKNHPIITRSGGYPKLLPSKQYTQYLKDCAVFIPKGEPIRTPVNVKAVFYMQTRRRCDLVNLLQALDDILVHYGVIEDDNYKIVASHDGSRVCYDKEHPRTEVEIKEAHNV
ncbi:MAG: RusA family crossover junction endodeoxyribonuclease [Bilifractor sp.]|jgi:Holliday junction resolvase RusA-like endonuclease